MTEETSGRDWLADADTAAGLLRTARRLFVITGAGISADSGLPTYRGIGGLYDDTHTEDAIPIEQALSGSMLARRPAITWKYLAQIERACRGARPNRAHELLAAFDRHFAHVCVLTQNIDGFHRDAGSRHLIEMHGDVHRLQCTACDWRARVTSFDEVVGGLEEKDAVFEAKRCLSCGNCYECDGCFGACPEDAVVKLGKGKRYRFNYDLCTGCAVCFEQCPCHAIEMTPEP